jgi:hypothetical protein
MADDFVINVRQIAQYPLRSLVSPTDAFLLQSNGPGGAYAHTTPYGLLTALATVDDPITFGGPLNIGGPLSFSGQGQIFAPGGLWLSSQVTFDMDAFMSGNLSVDGTATVGGDTVATQTWVTTQIQGTIVVSGTAPPDPFAGMPWFDSTDSQLYVFNGSAWVIAVNPPAGAPLNSPAFTGTPTVNGAVIASTPDITNAINALRPTIVTSFNGRLQGVTLLASDITGAGGALLSSPNFTGQPTAPTQTAGNSSTMLATTAFVSTADTNLRAWVNAQGFARVTGATFTSLSVSGNPVATQIWVTNQIAALNVSRFAPLASPHFTGTPTINGNSVATQTWVEGQIATLNLSQYAPRVAPVFTGGASFEGDVNVDGILTANQVRLAFMVPANANDNRTPSTAWVHARIDEHIHELHIHDYALIDSPHFIGMPTAPTPEPRSNDGKLATTAFVLREIEHHTAGVASFGTRTGHVHLINADIEQLNTWARLHSPNFTGDPHAPNPPPADRSERIATTHFMHELLEEGGVISFNGRHGRVELELFDIENARGAPIRNPEFEGLPKAPTPHHQDDSERIATTAFVKQAVEDHQDDWLREFNCLQRNFEELKDGTVWSFNQRRGRVTLHLNDILAAGGAPQESPDFCGEPRAPTPEFGSRDRQIATTEFVHDAVKAIPSGPPGLSGPPGPPGPPGPMAQVTGSVQSYSQLPFGAPNGEIWEVRDTGTLYIRTFAGWDAVVWTDAPHDGHLWARENGSWQETLHTHEIQTLVASTVAAQWISAPFLPLSGGRMTNVLAGGGTGLQIHVASGNATDFTGRGLLVQMDGASGDGIFVDGNSFWGGQPDRSLVRIRRTYNTNAHLLQLQMSAGSAGNGLWINGANSNGNRVLVETTTAGDNSFRITSAGITQFGMPGNVTSFNAGITGNGSIGMAGNLLLSRGMASELQSAIEIWTRSQTEHSRLFLYRTRVSGTTNYAPAAANDILGSIDFAGQRVTGTGFGGSRLDNTRIEGVATANFGASSTPTALDFYAIPNSLIATRVMRMTPATTEITGTLGTAPIVNIVNTSANNNANNICLQVSHPGLTTATAISSRGTGNAAHFRTFANDDATEVFRMERTGRMFSNISGGGVGLTVNCLTWDAAGIRINKDVAQGATWSPAMEIHTAQGSGGQCPLSLVADGSGDTLRLGGVNTGGLHIRAYGVDGTTEAFRLERAGRLLRSIPAAATSTAVGYGVIWGLNALGTGIHIDSGSGASGLVGIHFGTDSVWEGGRIFLRQRDRSTNFDSFVVRGNGSMLLSMYGDSTAPVVDIVNNVTVNNPSFRVTSGSTVDFAIHNNGTVTISDRLRDALRTRLGIT